MQRVFLVLAALAVMLVGWLVLFEGDGPRQVPSSQDDPGSEPAPVPELVAQGSLKTPPMPPLVVDDSFDFVVKLGPVISADMRNALRRLAVTDPTFLAALIEKVRVPQNKPPEWRGNPSNRAAKKAVLRALSWIGEAAAKPLAALLRDADEAVRIRGAEALRALGPDAAVAVPALLAIARDPKQGVDARTMAVDALGAVGPPARDALPFLHGLLRNTLADEWLVRAAGRSLVPIGRASPAVLDTCREVFRGSRYRVTSAVVKSLDCIGTDAAPLVPDLLRLFDSPRAEDALWESVPMALVPIGVASDEVIAFLRALYDRSVTDETGDDGGAAFALARLGAKGRAELLALTAADEGARMQALRDMHESGVAGAALVAPALTLLGSGDAGIRQSAVELIGRLKPDGARVFEALGPLLTDPQEAVRVATLIALPALRSPPTKAWDAALAATTSDAPLIANAGLTALTYLAPHWPDKGIAYWKRRLQSEAEDDRINAVYALGTMFAVSPHDVMALWMQSLEEPKLAELVAYCLVKNTDLKQTPALLAAQRKLLAHTSPKVRALGLIAVQHAPRKSDLALVLPLATDPDAYVRAHACLTLSDLYRHGPKPILAALMRALDDDDHRVRTWTASSLATIGPAAISAAPKLQALVARDAKHGLDVRHYANALRRLRGEARPR